MSRRKITAGTTNLTLGIFVQDTSSTTGGGLAGLTNTTPGLVAEYRRQGETTWTNIPLVAGTLGAYTSGAIVADGALAGAYEYDPPNACFVAGATWVKIRLRGAANMLPVLLEFELDAVNYQDAAGFGLSRLDTTISSRLPPLRRGIAQAGQAAGITLDAGASSLSDFYMPCAIALIGGTGEGQSRNVTAYNGTSKVALVSPPWTVEPDNTTVFSIIPVQLGTSAPIDWIRSTTIQNGAFTAAKFAAGAFDAVWTVLTSGLTLAGSIGKLLVDNINATISSRPTLAQIEASTVLAKEATVSGGFTNTNNLITALNNLSAKMNIFGAPLLEVPDSGSTVYAFTVVVRDDEDALVNLSGTPTITAANSAAVDRSANLSAVSNPSTGRYTFTYTVANTHPKESLRITVSGNVSGSARYIEWIGAVVDYDTLTTLQDVQTKVTNIQTRIPAALIGGRMSSDVGTWAGQAVAVDTSNIPVTSVRNYFDTDLTTWLPISGRFSTIITNVGNVPTAVLDTVVDNGLTVRQCIRIANSVLHGAATGLNTTPVFKSLDGTKDRVVGTVASGNRTITSRDGT